MIPDELIEAMARAVRDGLNEDGTFDVRSPDQCSLDDQEQGEWDAVCRATRAILDLLPTLGLAVVPVEATEGMRKEAHIARVDGGTFADCWEASLRASPFYKEPAR